MPGAHAPAGIGPKLNDMGATGPIHRLATLVLSVAMTVIGLALIIQSAVVAHSVLRLVLGVLFVAAGAGRVWIELRRGRAT